MIFLFANFAESTLEARLSQGDTVARVPSSEAARFPQPGAGEVCAVTLQDGKQDPEIVYITSNPLTGAMTVERGKEGTAVGTWMEGSLFVHTLTKASISWFSTGGAGAEIADLQAQIDGLTTSLAASNATIAALQAFVNASDADLIAMIEQSNASIATSALVIADTNYALAQLDLTLTAEVSSNSAQISNLFTVTANTDSALAIHDTTLTASINGVQANLTIFQTAQATTNEAVSSSISSFSASIGGLTADVTATATAIATLDGNLSGKYVVAVTAGRFASLELAAGSGTSSYSYFALRVSDFYISDPSGTYTPFYFNTSTGTAYLQNVYITNAVIENLTIGTTKIANDAISQRGVAVSTTTWSNVGDGNTLLYRTITPSTNEGVLILSYSNWHFPSSRRTMVLQMYRNGSPIGGAYARASYDGQDEIPMTILFYDDSVSAGVSYTYELVKISGGADLDFYSGVLVVQEFKK